MKKKSLQIVKTVETIKKLSDAYSFVNNAQYVHTHIAYIVKSEQRSFR